MDLDPVFLSRLQFAWVIAWHILLPAFTVGLAAFIAVLEGLNFFTGREVYLRVSMFWIKIFSISFGMGVVTGIVMPFQFGTNWSRYADATANVLSPLFAYEGLTAFFLEAAFLGVLLFGRKLVPPWAHFVAALMVALGTLFSSFWILSANSWMQTPAGYEIIDGRFFPTDWLQVVFNPSFPFRLAHTVVAFFITTGFVVMGVGAYLMRRGRFAEEGRIMLSMTLWLLTVLVPLQIFLGDQHGLNTREHQPAKLAAIEARWETGRRVPITLFAIPDEKAETNYFSIDVPLLGSLILTHELDGEVKGLKDFPADQRPPVAIPFFAFRIMVGCGLRDACCRAAGRLAALARPARRYAALSSTVPARNAHRLHCRHRRMGRDGSRTPALDGLRPVAHGGLGIAVVDRPRRADLLARLHGRIPVHVSCRHAPHVAHRAQRTGRGRGG